MIARTCACATHTDGSVTTMLCPLHASQDPCLTMSQVTGRRRTGSIRAGRCTACGYTGEAHQVELWHRNYQRGMITLAELVEELSRLDHRFGARPTQIARAS